jgi:hypothetical protein
MATTLSLTTTYAGELAGEIVKKALLQNSSMQYVNLRENVPYKSVARKIDDTVTFAAGTCDFTPTGTVTLTERILTLEEFQVQRQICKKDFFGDWSSADVMSGKVNTQIQDAIVERLVNGIAANLESVMWTGVNATTGQFDGFNTIIDTNAGSDINFVASPVALTSGNILDKIWALIAKCPTAVKGSAEKPMIYMNQTTFELYMQAQIAAGNGWYATAGPEISKKFVGLYEIAVCPGMPANTMYMVQKSNLHLGTWLSNDLNDVSIIDMTPLDGSQNVRYGARFYLGAQIAVTADVAAYGPGLS